MIESVWLTYRLTYRYMLTQADRVIIPIHHDWGNLTYLGDSQAGHVHKHISIKLLQPVVVLGVITRVLPCHGFGDA